jgi:hypothetical protein
MKNVIVLLLLGVSVLQSQVWVYKVTGSALGNPLTYNPLNSNILYGSVGNNKIYISRDRGYTWTQMATPVFSSGIIKSIDVSPLDTLQMLVGLEMGNGVPDKILKTTDGGQTWKETWQGSFNYYGRPIEFKIAHPETVYTMGLDTLWRSTDFGSTWDTVKKVTGFNAWCDAEIRPDSANIIYIGDNTSGIWKTTDYGITWRRVYTTSGEIPSIAIDPFNPQIAYATKYSGGGGVLKTTNGGETWFPLTTPIGSGSTWWITTSTVSPNYVYFGTFGPLSPNNGPYISRDAGATWRRIGTSQQPGPDFNVINFGLLALDTLSVIALQANGIWKLQYPAGIRLLSPNGGEFWSVGSTQTIFWKDSGLTANVKIQFSKDSGATWITIANNIPPGTMSFQWTVPNLPSTRCLIKVSDTLIPSHTDISDMVFTIYVPSLYLTSPNGGEVWRSGTMKQITWTSEGPTTVTIEYSADAGKSWKTIAYVSAAFRSYNWIVPTTPTSQAKIGLRDSYLNLVDQSDSTFTVISEPEFVSSLLITDNGKERDTLQFGVRTGATDGLDSSLGEIPLPPKPSPGSFDIRWKIDSLHETSLDLRDSLSELNRENIYIGEIQPGEGGYPLSLFWNPESLGSGIFTLRDYETHGMLLSADMKRESTLVISDSALHVFEIRQCQSIDITIQGNDNGWALLSLPLEVFDRTKSVLFPYSTSDAFAFQGGYVPVNVLEYGKGYWLKTGNVGITGCALLEDTIDVTRGWNIIGSLSGTVPLSSIQTIPETLITSPFYGFDNGYFSANEINPGRGYWVKVQQNGKIILHLTSLQKSFVPIQTHEVISQNYITFTDASGYSATLYVGNQGKGFTPLLYELPPPPPDGVFDVRFSPQQPSGLPPQNVENALDYAILFSFATYPISCSWRVEKFQKFSYILLKINRQGVSKEMLLEGSGNIRLDLEEREKLVLSIRPTNKQQERAVTFSLEQNFPNPFNPSTQVRYSIPVDALVTVKVYSSLGQEVGLLVNGVQQAGTYTVSWDGKDSQQMPVSSGIYFVRMIATSVAKKDLLYSNTKKILLLK